MFTRIQDIDVDKYVLVTYHIKSKNLEKAIHSLAIGQSVGNPSMRSCWETPELFENHGCIIAEPAYPLEGREEASFLVGFPVVNFDFNTDGVAHLLVNIMGGQLDIDIIDRCAVLNVILPKHIREGFLGPKYGIKGIREFTKVEDKPILGAIMKPKTGVSSSVMLDMVKALADGGVNFIKEDEILSSPAFCMLQERIPIIMSWLHNHAPNVIYSASIHSDPYNLLHRVQNVYEMGGNSVHVNFWCGFGAYKSIRHMNLPLFLHYQKSGDKILTNRNHGFYIDQNVIFDLISLSGCDFAHAGMIGGYYKWPQDETELAVHTLRKNRCMPALSCGFTADMVKPITDAVGIDYMANVGGFIHSHKDGTTGGALAMRKAIDAL